MPSYWTPFNNAGAYKFINAAVTVAAVSWCQCTVVPATSFAIATRRQPIKTHHDMHYGSTSRPYHRMSWIMSVALLLIMNASDHNQLVVTMTSVSVAISESNPWEGKIAQLNTWDFVQDTSFYRGKKKTKKTLSWARTPRNIANHH